PRLPLMRQTETPQAAPPGPRAPGPVPVPAPPHQAPARRRCAPNRPATTTTPPRSRTGGTARTGAGWPTAPAAARPPPSGPAIPQHQVVVAEEPEDPPGRGQRAGVAIAVQRPRALPDPPGEPVQHRRIQRLADGAAATVTGITTAGVRRREAEDEPACVQYLD